VSRTASIIAAVGMGFEARIAQGPRVEVVRCANAGDAGARLEAAIARGARGIVSFGIAGGLDPALRPGDILVASAVHHNTGQWRADAAWSSTLLRMLPDAKPGKMLGADAPVTTAQDKQALHRTHGFAAVDTESHIAAAAAARHGLPFVALRVVADDAASTLPEAALAGFGAGGRVNVIAVLAKLARSPQELAPLIRLARHTSLARRSLARARRHLGPHFGLLDLD